MELPSPELFSARLERIRAALLRDRLDGLVIVHLPNVQYLTGYSGSTAIAVITAARLVLITDARYATEVERDLLPICPGLELVRVAPTYDQTLSDVLVELSPSRVGIEAAYLPIGRYRFVASAVAGRLAPGKAPIELVDTTRIVEAERLVKDPFEQSALRRAGLLLTTVTVQVLGELRAGQTEAEIAADIDWSIKHAGFERPSFDTIVASGPNGALPHARPGARRLQAGDLVVLDFGGVLDGYCVDTTRTASVGEPGSEARRVHDAVLKAQEAALLAARPGVRVSELDEAARGVLTGLGLASAFVHATGHGLGLEIHEEPRVGPARADIPGVAPVGRDEVLCPGIAITIEPGAYVPNWGGVRIEDDILITEHGCEILTSASRALVVV